MAHRFKTDKEKRKFSPYKFTRSSKVVPFFSRNTEFSAFSNFHKTPTQIVHLGRTAPTTEHHYHATVALLFRADSIREQIVPVSGTNFPSAVEAKVIGKNFKQSLTDGDTAKLVPFLPSMMRAIVLQKFDQNDLLKRKLLQTSDFQLWECNKYDEFWGVGISPHEFYDGIFPKWGSKNIMGKILEEVRELYLTGHSWGDTICVTDSQGTRLKYLGPDLPFPIFAWSGGKLDHIFRMALILTNPTITKCVIIVGTNNILLNKADSSDLTRSARLRPKRFADLVGSKILYVQQFHPQVHFYLLKIFPRFDFAEGSALSQAPECFNKALHKKFDSSKWAQKCTIVPVHDNVNDKKYFNQHYSSGDVDGIHINRSAVAKLHPILSKLSSDRLPK